MHKNSALSSDVSRPQLSEGAYRGTLCGWRNRGTACPEPQLTPSAPQHRVALYHTAGQPNWV